jgi:uncharacterized protein (TIGR02996 family)
MNDGWALLRGIEQEPGDDVPRLAYADWLEDDGDAARAELIRLQVARRPDEPPSAREAELLAAHQEWWVGEIHGQVFHPTFRRGFLNPLYVSALDFAREGGRMAAVAPLHHVRLFAAPACAEDLARSAVLRRVRRLSLVSNVIRNADVTALASSPHLVNLASLNLGSNHVGIAGCRALAAAELPALRRLTLTASPIKERGLEAILGAAWAGRLESLGLSGCPLGPSSPTAIASSLGATLRRLDLSHTSGFSWGAVADLAGAPLPALEWLGLVGVVDDETVARLTANPSLANLRGLWLGGGETDYRARAILDSPHLTGLRRLYLDWPRDGALRQRLVARFGAGVNQSWQADGEWDEPATSAAGGQGEP